MELKRIQLYPSNFNPHTGFNSLLKHPPRGYSFLPVKQNFKTSLIYKLYSLPFLKRIYRSVLSRKTAFFHDFSARSKVDESAELVLSLGYIYSGDKPWILYILDSPLCITGHNYQLFMKNKNKIESALLSSNCRKIICENPSSLEIIKKYFSPKIIRKTAVVRQGIEETNFTRKKKKSKEVTLLFLGSINNPADFYVKGGLYVIETFKKIKDKNVRLIIRCKLPEEIREKVKNIPGITIIEQEISRGDLENLYKRADIFFQPAHIYVLMAIMEAMSYSLPIVNLDTYAVKDYVKNGYNGFSIPKSESIKEYYSPAYPGNIKSDSFLEAMKKADTEVINALKDKIQKLIENPALRLKIGSNSCKLIKNKFSIKRRNLALKKIFDKSLSNEE